MCNGLIIKKIHWAIKHNAVSNYFRKLVNTQIETRNQYKKTNETMANTIKIISNSFYGKCLQRFQYFNQKIATNRVQNKDEVKLTKNPKNTPMEQTYKQFENIIKKV